MDSSIYVLTPRLIEGMQTAEPVLEGTHQCLPQNRLLRKADILKIFSLLKEGVLVDAGSIKNPSQFLATLQGYNPTFTRTSLVEAREILDIITSGSFRSFLRCLEVYDVTTYIHSLSVAALSVLIAMTAASFDRKQLEDLGISAVLHDIGKMAVPREIICKCGALSTQEHLEVMKHPRYGLELVEERSDLSDLCKLSIYQHHEDISGSEGYPEGTSGSQITEYAKIIHVADVYDALTSFRPYREPLPAAEGLAYLKSHSGIKFEEKYVSLFEEICL